MSTLNNTTFDAAFATALERESWSWYAVGAILIILRIITKVLFAGKTQWRADDAVAFLAFTSYTGAVVTLNYIASAGGSNLINPDDLAQYTTAESKHIIYNSKIVVLSEQFYMNTLYFCKACVIMFFYRITAGQPTQTAIIVAAVAVALAYIATQIAFFTACRPFSQYWALVPTNAQCTTLETYGYVQQGVNIPTDLLMLLITLPMVIRLKLGIRQKIVIGSVFGLGGFVILMAVLNVIETNINYYSSSYMLWYIREDSVALYVATVPHVWPLLMHAVPGLAQTVNYSRNFYASTRSKQSDVYAHYAIRAGASCGSEKGACNATVGAADSVEELGKLYGIRVVTELEAGTGPATADSVVGESEEV